MAPPEVWAWALTLAKPNNVATTGSNNVVLIISSLHSLTAAKRITLTPPLLEPLPGQQENAVAGNQLTSISSRNGN